MIHCYGNFPDAIKKSLEKVGTLLHDEKQAVLLFRWERDDAFHAVHALMNASEDFERAAIEDVSLFLVKLQEELYPDPPEGFGSWEHPFDLRTLYGRHAKRGDAVKVVAEAIVKYRNLGGCESLALTAHNSAVKELWQGNDVKIEGNVLQARALLIDDHVTLDPESSVSNHWLKSASKLLGLGFDVFLAKRLESPENNLEALTIKKPLQAKIGVNKTELIPHTVHGIALDMSDVDVVFLDIAEDIGGQQFILSGLGRDLHLLNSMRSLLPVPQIYMLSHLKRPLIAHLCLANGADYYLEKEEFLHDRPFPLGKLLAHTTKTLRGRDISHIKTEYWLPKVVDEWDKFLKSDYDAETDNVKKKEIQDYQSNVRTFAYQLYGQTHHVNRVEFLKVLGGGLSGAAALFVRPHDKHGAQRPRVMKVASKYETAMELHAYKHLVEPYVSDGFARIESNWVSKDDMGCISYEFAGADYEGEQVVEFEAVKDLLSIEQAIQYLDLLFGRMDTLHCKVLSADESERDLIEAGRYFRSELVPPTILEWPKKSNDSNDTFIFEILKVSINDDKTLTAKVGLKQYAQQGIESLRTWSVKDAEQNLGPKWLLYPGKTFRSVVPGNDAYIGQECGCILNGIESEKVKELKSKLEKYKLDQGLVDIINTAMGDSPPKQWKITTPWGIVHGDLHTKNFLVNEDVDGAGLWIIDYGKTRQGPPAMDYIVLEYELKRGLFALLGHYLENKTLSAGDWVSTVMDFACAFEDALGGASFKPPKICVALQKNPAVTRAIHLIRHIRRRAFHKFYDDDRKYHFFLFLFLFYIRVTQHYKGEAKEDYGPVGIAWAAAAANALAKDYLS
jgi:thiamine kinase-like enzyme